MKWTYFIFLIMCLPELVVSQPFNNEAHDVIVDKSGNVYVTGSGKVEATDYNYVTVKYNTVGEEQWIATYNGPGNTRDEAFAIALDDSANVFVTGCSGDDIVTIKYNNSGIRQWVSRFDGKGDQPDEGRDIVVDESGEVYVAGRVHGPETDYDFITIKYNANGQKYWALRYNGPGNGVDEAAASVLDSDGNVYITGFSDGGNSTGLDYATIKYNPFGVQQWLVRYDAGNGDDKAHAIAVSGDNDIFIAGESFKPDTNLDYALLKYNASGVRQWAVRFNGTANAEDAAYAVAVDQTGHACVTGTSKNQDTGNDYVTLKYNASGVKQWQASYDGPADADDNDRAADIVIDNVNDIYVTGNSVGAASLSDFATLKYNSSGVRQWVARFNGQENSDDQVFAIAIDQMGTTYVTGKTKISDTEFDFATVKYNSSGVQQWVTRLDTLVMTDVHGKIKKPVAQRLYQNFPNPFNASTVIQYDVPGAAYVKLNIFDVTGRKVYALVNGRQTPGYYSYHLDASHLVSGVYFYTLNIGDTFSDMKQMLIIR